MRWFVRYINVSVRVGGDYNRFERDGRRVAEKSMSAQCWGADNNDVDAYGDLCDEWDALRSSECRQMRICRGQDASAPALCRLARSDDVTCLDCFG
jgi:hypothetical protein